MELIVWKDEYLIGVKAIDEQHKKLVALINRLAAAMEEGAGEQAVGNVLVEMVDYAKVHFRAEEGLFRVAEFPELQKHKLLHEQFVGQVKIFASGFLGGDARIGTEMLSFLKEWLVSHIGQSDRKYADFIRNREEKS